MRSKLAWVLIPGLIALFALALSSCGDDDNGGGGGTTGGQFAPPTAAPDNAKTGGHLDAIAAGDVDYIDPGAAYYQFTYMVDSATQRQLASWNPDDTAEPTPDIATGEPEISDDGLTITWHLRDDVKFSPPVNRPVIADDFKYAIERAMLPGVANGYVGSYLVDVSGFADAQAAVEQDDSKAPDISGITTPDDQTLVIKLDDTSSAGVLGALSLPLGSPVPREYAEKFDAENPSTYGQNQVASGAYMIRNDCVDENGEVTDPNCSGEAVGYVSGEKIELVRNPNWDESTDERPAYLDSITVKEGFADTVSAGKKIIQGSHEINGDFSAPPGVIKQAAQSDTPETLTVTPSGGNRYVAFNTTEPPFDDINVRKAVIANANRVDLRNTRGGELVGPVATHFIPPNFLGFEEAGGLEGDPSNDFVTNTEGDPDLAAEYMQKAGFDSGQCEGDCDITMVGDDSPPGSDTATVVKAQLEQLGFNVHFQKVTHDIMYTRYCNVPDNEPNVCPNVGWLKDFTDPQSMLQLTFSGDSIVETNNSNWPLLDDPQINKDIHDAIYVDDPDERAQAWGDIDTEITAQAPAIPWVWDNQANIQSPDVAGVINLFNANWDLRYTSLK